MRKNSIYYSNAWQLRSDMQRVAFLTDHNQSSRNTPTDS